MRLNGRRNRVLQIAGVAFATLLIAETGALARQEIEQCYLEGEPCGTPDELYRKLSTCFQDAASCRVRMLASRTAAEARFGPEPARSAEMRRAQAARAPAALTPSAAIAQPGQLGPSSPTAEVAALAETLPLDPAVRGLRDALPPDPDRIEAQLGLRHTAAAVIDMRGRTPSTEEIVLALMPSRARAQ